MINRGKETLAAKGASGRSRSKPPPLPKKRPGVERPAATPGKPRRLPPPLPSARRKSEEPLDIHISVEIPQTPPGPPPLRIQDKALEVHVVKLFRQLIKEDNKLGEAFRDLTPRIDKDKNVVIGGKVVGRIFTENEHLHIRIYFDKIGWSGKTEQKVRMFTSSVAFVFSSVSKCKFFVVDKRGFRLAYGNTPDGPIAMMV